MNQRRRSKPLDIWLVTWLEGCAITSCSGQQRCILGVTRGARRTEMCLTMSYYNSFTDMLNRKMLLIFHRKYVIY